MIRKTIIITVILVLSVDFCKSQAFVRTENLFKRPEGVGTLNISQSQAVDTLISRYILANKKHTTPEGTLGMQGYRIQIYYNSVRNAREESAKTRAEFINKFPDIVSYSQYQEPGWFMVRVGDYRTKIEAYKYLLQIRKVFPNAYPVPAIINFPDLIKK
jgi:hypothetical protein